MSNEMSYFINHPIFVKYKKRFSFKDFKSHHVLKSVFTNERIIEIPFVIQSLAVLPANAGILDLGCTESPLPLQLAVLGYQVTGFDFRDYPYWHPNLTFTKGDMTQLPFASKKFDAVLSVSTLEHVGVGFYEDPNEVQAADKKAIGEIVRVLKSGGTFILTAPYGKSAQNVHQRIYDEHALGELLTDFHIEKIRYFKSILPSQASCNTWVELLKHEAADIASPQKTECVCLVNAKKK